MVVTAEVPDPEATGLLQLTKDRGIGRLSP